MNGSQSRSDPAEGAPTSAQAGDAETGQDDQEQAEPIGRHADEDDDQGERRPSSHAGAPTDQCASRRPVGRSGLARTAQTTDRRPYAGERPSATASVARRRRSDPA